MGYQLITLVTLAALSSSSAQLTAQPSTAPSLRECYDNATLLNRNNLAPMTISVLIDIIRKIEDSNSISLRQLAVTLLHTYRQDGIEYHQTANLASNVLPYAPTFYTFYRHKLLLTKLLPNNLLTFGNETVSSVLKCTLHHMLSTTIQTQSRGDEGTVCAQLSHYRALRVPRDLRNGVTTGEDVEILDDRFVKSANQKGRLRQFNNKDAESFANPSVAFEKQVLAESLCPLQDGVIHTRWGAVSAGSLLAGIAAGAEPQTVRVSELIKGTISSYEDAASLSVDTRYPSTLSGDLAEAALRQGSAGSQTVTIGANGGWNSTQPPKYYYLNQRTNMEMTDSEIRGDIDGFVLGQNFQQLTSSYSNLKLSTLIDMYYSPFNGVSTNAYRACNRKTLFQQSTTTERLVTEAYSFAVALDSNMPLTGTITSGLEVLVSNAVSNLQNYISTNLNDLTCATTESTSQDYRQKTNLYVVLDASWQYNAIYPAISYLLNTLEVSKYGSSITLLSAATGHIVINKTFSIADFHAGYTQSRHDQLPYGVNLPSTFSAIRAMALEDLENERARNYIGGNSTVLLFLLNTLNLQQSEEEFVFEQARAINETVPDLRIMFATSTNQQGTLWRFVRDLEDIMTVTLSATGTNTEQAVASVLDRINLVPRRIVNPLCGSTWHEENTVSGTRNFVDYVEPGYINFYGVHANYFYHQNDNRRLRVERSGTGTGTLRVCWSRTVRQPRQGANNTVILDPNLQNEVTCQDLGTTGNVEINLSHACDGYGYIGACPNVYLSVQSVVDGTSNTLASQCTEDACRFPYSVRYSVVIQDFGCFSGAASVVVNTLLLLAAFVLATRQML